MAFKKGRGFGKTQKADDDFRKKKKERGENEKRPRTRTGTGGSTYAGGKRRFSAGPRDEKRSFRKDDGERKPFRKDDSSFGSSRNEKRPFRRDDGERKSFKRNDGERRSSRGYGDEKRPFRPRRDDDKKPFRARRDDDKKPFRPRRDDAKPFKKRGPVEKRSFVESKVESHRERVEQPSVPKKEMVPSADGLIRLNKYISNSGVCSRREADDLIKMGVITVNGTTITEMGYKVKPTDDVRHDGKRLTAEKPVYILLNKPKGFITTTDDPQERNTVMQLIAGACKERVYPVGRLDRNTTGLLLLTNDGDLTDKLTHPSFNAKKIYKVELDKPLTKNDFQRILDGIQLEEGKAIVDDLAIVSDDGKTVGVELHIGWNHVVRRIFDALQYSVVKLDRVVYAGLDKKDLKRGQWRFLRNDEIVRLKHFK